MPVKQSSKWNGNIPIGGLTMVVFLLFHTIFYLLFDFYSTTLYLLASPALTALTILNFIEGWYPTFSNIGINVICGIWGPICVAVMPEFASFGYGAHNIGLILMVFFESKKYSLYFLFGRRKGPKCPCKFSSSLETIRV